LLKEDLKTPLLKIAQERSFKRQNAIGGFCNTGLYPLNRDKITEEKLKCGKFWYDDDDKPASTSRDDYDNPASDDENDDDDDDSTTDDEQVPSYQQYQTPRTPQTPQTPQILLPSFTQSESSN